MLPLFTTAAAITSCRRAIAGAAAATCTDQQLLPAAAATALAPLAAVAALVHGRGSSAQQQWQQRQRRQFSSSAAPANSAAAASVDVRGAYEHCAQLVQQHDPDNFAWVVQLPPALRRRVLALRAFNLETLLVGEQAKSQESLALQIRYQWWRDALTGLTPHAPPPPPHPVLTALWDVQRQLAADAATAAADASTTTTTTSSSTSEPQQQQQQQQQKKSSKPPLLSRYQLKRLLDAREADALSFATPFSLADLEAYAEATASQLLYLQLAAGGVASRDADHAASHLGKAVGLALLLRGAPFMAARRRCYLPVQLCSERGVSQESVYRGEVSEGLRDVVLAVATAAVGHLREARALAPRLPPAAPRVMLQGVVAGQYLEGLERAGFNPFDQALATTGGASPLRRTVALKWAALRGRF